MSSGALKLQVVYDWGETCLAQRLLEHDERITFGNGAGVELITPEGQHDHLGRDPWPGYMALARPTKSGYRLRLMPAMTGRMLLQGQSVDIGGLFATPAPKRLLRKPPMYREVAFAPGDTADIVVDAINKLRLSLSFVEPPETLVRPRLVDPLLFKSAFWTINSLLTALIVIIFVGSRVPPFTPRLDISPERLAKIAPRAPDLNPAVKLVEERNRAEAEARRKKQEREAAASRKAKEAEGRIGRADANKKDIVIPKGREDVLREKVSKTGLLAIIGSSRAPSAGISKLLSADSDVEQAINGVTFAKTASAGRSAQGLGVAGTGLGGGGDSFGRIQGSGNHDFGGRGRGRRGPNLGSGKERQVSVGLETGSADAEGGLSRQQVERVVIAHKAAIKYCFDKELQRAPHLNGKVELAWVVRANGSVDRARVGKSALNNAAVEGCMIRTLKSWQFPKADADTIVQSYPFFFKGTGG